MKRNFGLITVLTTISLIGIIVIQYFWLKNIITIKKEQIAHKTELVEYEVVESLVEEKMRSAPNVPSDVLPQGAQNHLLDFFGAQTMAEHFTVNEIQQRIAKAFASNGLKGAKFEFAILSNANNMSPELESPNYLKYYEDAIKDTVNYVFHVWPLAASPEEEAMPYVPKEKLVLVIYDIQGFVLKSVGWMILFAVLFTLIIIAAFYITIRTILTQKKLSEMKTDFINNMTHELRTPLATISIAVDTLKNEKIIGNRDQLLSIGQIIKSENTRMNTQVEQILQAAQLDVNQVLNDMKDLQVHEVMRKIDAKFALQVKEKNGAIALNLDAKNDRVSGHPVHFMNMISNLVDNALKYCKEEVPPLIVISTSNERNKIIIVIKDNGLGMSKDTMSKIFEKFYRAHTGDVHNVKGFGLGLNYSKKMVEAHHGTIEVASTLGVGSTFTVKLPLR